MKGVLAHGSIMVHGKPRVDARVKTGSQGSTDDTISLTSGESPRMRV